MAHGEACRGCLRATLRCLNYLLALAGVLMMCYALHMKAEFENSSSPPSPPAPLGIRLQRHTSIPAGRAVILSALEADPAVRQESLPPARVTQTSLGKYPWFIYLFGGAGALLFLTAALGVLSADFAGCGVTCFLGLYHLLLTIQLLLQAAVVAYCFFDKSWEDDLPPDETGEYDKVRRLVLHNLFACEVSGIAVLAVQLLALVLSCSVLYAESAQRRLDYDALDQYNLETASTRSSTRATGSRLPGAGPGRGAPERQGNEAWNRVCTKYGLDDGPGFDPEQARLAAGADETVVETRRRSACSIM